MFYQSDCELVTFDTVELFFLRKEDIYLYIEQGGRTSHCLSYCHSQEQSCINKNVLKSVISLTRNVHCLDVLFGQKKGKALTKSYGYFIEFVQKRFLPLLLLLLYTGTLYMV